MMLRVGVLLLMVSLFTTAVTLRPSPASAEGIHIDSTQVEWTKLCAENQKLFTVKRCTAGHFLIQVLADDVQDSGGNVEVRLVVFSNGTCYPSPRIMGMSTEYDKLWLTVRWTPPYGIPPGWSYIYVSVAPGEFVAQSRTRIRMPSLLNPDHQPSGYVSGVGCAQYLP